MKKWILFSFFFLFARVLFAETPAPATLLEAMDNVLRSHSHHMTVTMDVKTKSWQRHYKMQVWMKGMDHVLVRILEPPKSAGQGFLRLKSKLWNYLPSAERTMLIPLSMMTDKVLGSDFSNDDLVKLSYLPRDYNSQIVGEETVEGMEAYHLELRPKPDAPVTYEKLELWLRKNDSAPLQMIFFDEHLKPLRTLHYSAFKTIDGLERPTVWRMENHKDPSRETTLTILEAEYGIEIPDNLFSQENMEKYP